MVNETRSIKKIGKGNILFRYSIGLDRFEIYPKGLFLAG